MLVPNSSVIILRTEIQMTPDFSTEFPKLRRQSFIVIHDFFFLSLCRRRISEQNLIVTSHFTIFVDGNNTLILDFLPKNPFCAG